MTDLESIPPPTGPVDLSGFCRVSRLVLGATLGASLCVSHASAAQPEPSATSTDPVATDGGPDTARAVRTQPDPETCVEAHEKAVDFADGAQLLEARDRFSVCVAPACPRVIRDECASELSRLRSRLPSVVFAATNEAGNDMTDVTVTLAGRAILHTLTSRAISLNPGRYEFQLSSSDGTTEKRVVLLREGEQQRRVEVRFPGTAQLAPLVQLPPLDDSPWTPPVVISTVVGALGLVSFGYFAIAGTSMESCSPHCAEDEIASMRVHYAIADVSLLVGLAGITTAIILYEPNQSAVRARLTPTRGGVGLDAAWAF